jgi:malate dehydrogenase
VEQVKKQAPDSILIVVSNPLDAMTYLAQKRTGWPRERVIGMAGVLDTARFRSFIAMELKVSLRDVQAMVLGGHGDTMVPVARYASVSGIPLTELVSKERIDAMIQRTRDGGAEIVNLLKTGSAFYAPSASVAAMVEAIMLDEKRLMPCCVNLKGEFGLKDVYVGVPVILGAKGVEKVVEVPLSPEEMKLLEASAAHVRETCQALDRVTAATA